MNVPDTTKPQNRSKAAKLEIRSHSLITQTFEVKLNFYRALKCKLNNFDLVQYNLFKNFVQGAQIPEKH